jgi:hypothetical protein
LDSQRVGQDVVRQAADVLGHRRREEQCLALRRHVRHNPPNIGQKAHIKQAISLVEHEDFQRGQRHRALPQVIQQAARAGDRDINATAEVLALGEHAHAPIERHAPYARLVAEGRNRPMDLLGQFACRRHNERTQVPLRTRQQALQNGQGKRGGFPGPGLRQAQHVAALKHGGNGVRLDGRRGPIPERLHPRHEMRMQMERGKTHGDSFRKQGGDPGHHACPGALPLR